MNIIIGIIVIVLTIEYCQAFNFTAWNSLLTRNGTITRGNLQGYFE
jgi:hypothetical protein